MLERFTYHLGIELPYAHACNLCTYLEESIQDLSKVECYLYNGVTGDVAGIHVTYIRENTYDKISTYLKIGEVIGQYKLLLSLKYPELEILYNHIHM